MKLDTIEELGDRLATTSVEYVTGDSLQLISSFAYTFQLKYHSYLISVIPSTDTRFINISDQTLQLAKDLKDVLTNSSLAFIESIAKAKYLLDKLFFSCTEKGILNYRYQKAGLLTSSKIQAALKVSRTTLSRYVKLGMEVTQGSRHERYPLHNIFYWKEGTWASKIQALNEQYRLRNRTIEDTIRDLQEEIAQFELVYEGEFQEVFGELADPYELDDPEDYFNWRDATEELRNFNG